LFHATGLQALASALLPSNVDGASVIGQKCFQALLVLLGFDDRGQRDSM